MLVVLAVAALAVLGCVVAVALGHGGEMTEFPPDVPPLDLPEAGRLTAVDFMSLRIPVALVGYHTQSVDETLRRAATALSERDTRIAILEQRVAELLAGRLQARQEVYAKPAKPPRTEHLPEPPQGEPAEAPTSEGVLRPTEPFAPGELPAEAAAKPGDAAEEPAEGPTEPGDKPTEPRDEDETPTDESRPVAADEAATAEEDRTGPAEPARNGAVTDGAKDGAKDGGKDGAQGDPAQDDPKDDVPGGVTGGVTGGAEDAKDDAARRHDSRDGAKNGAREATKDGAKETTRPVTATTPARGDHGDAFEGEETW